MGDRAFFTANYAATATLGLKKINAELGGNTDRSAHFMCCLVLAWPDGHTEVFEGKTYGTITKEPLGDNGFAYDICFIPDGHNRTFAQMSQEEKALLSHRGKALRLFIERAVISK